MNHEGEGEGYAQKRNETEEVRGFVREAFLIENGVWWLDCLDRWK